MKIKKNEAKRGNLGTNIAWIQADYEGERSLQRRMMIKKALLILLILSAVLFLYIQRDSLRNREKVKLYQKTDQTESVKISLKGDHIIRQSFTAETGVLGNIFIRIQNPDASSASGSLRLSLEDSSGREISYTKLDASSIKINKRTQFVLGQDSGSANQNRIVSTDEKTYKNATTSVVRGRVYTIVLESIDVDGDGPINLLMRRNAPEADQSASQSESAYTWSGVEIDGKEYPDCAMDSAVEVLTYSTQTLLLLGLMLLISVIFIMIPFEAIDEKHPDRRLSVIISRLIFAAAPFAAFFIIEKYEGINLGAFVSMLFSFIGILNLLIIGMVCWLFYTLSNSTKIAALLTAAAGSVFGLVNYALLQFRDTPLIATDFMQAGTAMQVADTYSLTYSKDFLFAVFVTVLWCAVIMTPPGHKGLPLKKRVVPLLISVLWMAGIRYIFIESSLIKDHDFAVSGFKPKGSYIENGSSLSFAITVKNSIVTKPDDYSVDEIEALCSSYPSDKAVKANRVSEKTPNIIFVMNESYSDLAVLGEISANEDWMPFYRSLSDNTVKGIMDSSVYGGSTANSEFESLTGFSMRFMPYMSVPYRSIIRSELPSLAWYLKDMGYGGGIAFHPGMNNSYNRNIVYPLLGFNRHISIEDIKDARNIRDYMSDENDYEIVEHEYEEYRKSEKDAPFFLFNVTIQNHGGYKYKTGVVDAGITVDESDMGDETEVQFLNLIKYSDEALEGLIDYFSNVDEETVIVFFGDHQPRSDEIFLENMKKSHKGISELEWADLTHQVPFMIWANYDIEEKDDLTISANYISSYLKEMIGMPLTGFDKFLLDLRKDAPVITAIDYKDSEGRIYDPEKESGLSKRIEEYSRVQYNGIMDKDNRVSRFFELDG